MPRMLRGILLLGLFAAALAAQVQVSGRVLIPPERGPRLPGALPLPEKLPAAVWLLPAAVEPSLPGRGRSYALRVVWDSFRPRVLVVPAGAQVVFANQGTTPEPIGLLRPRGQRSFQTHCAVCHGGNGEAITPVGSSMRPNALNLTSPGLQRWSERHMARVVWRGIPGSGMPQWQRVLSYSQLRRIVHYVKQLPALDTGAELPPPSATARKAQGWISQQLGLLQPGASLVRRFSNQGMYPVRIAGQPTAVAYILVVPSPYTVVTGPRGNYRLPPALPGRYELVVWHPGSPVQTRVVNLRSNMRINLRVP